MATYVVVGLQYGDEGKGKITDVLSAKSDYVVRFQGGDNAGHTVYAGEEKYVLHLLPSGVLQCKGKCVIANGVVVNPKAFLKEIGQIEAKGLRTDHVFISRRAHVIMPYHILLDTYREEEEEGTHIGTTKKGIGPCYEDKIARVGIRMVDLLNPDVLAEKIRKNLKYSVEHPMSFMYQPKTGAIYDEGNHYRNDLNLVRDWIDNRRAQAANRWGHADKKSPFDPCPEGWRVPDVSFTNLYTGSKGNSPWYNGYKNDAYGKSGVIQDQWHNITSFYNGQINGDKGWKFESTVFPIGNFPKDGIRGELGENEISYDRSGVWTASMADLHTGYALAMQFQGSQMQTGTGVYPQAGMSVRCAKDDKRLLGTERKQNPKPIKVPKKAEISVPENKGIQLYPNPVTEEFHLTTTDAVTVEIYDMIGKLVLKTDLKTGAVNASRLTAGIYIVKITMKDQSVVTKKIIKQ